MARRSGFTLVEVLFVVIIAASAVALAVPAFKRSQERARYNAALGNLVSIGGAIEGLNRDLKMAGVSGSFPFGSSYQITVPQNITDASANQTLRQALAETSDKNALCLKALYYNNKYLSTGMRLDKENYNFWAVGSSSNGLCSGFCNYSDAANPVVACMCQASTTASKNGCYYGAAYYEDGSVKRMKLNTCSD